MPGCADGMRLITALGTVMGGYELHTRDRLRRTPLQLSDEMAPPREAFLDPWRLLPSLSRVYFLGTLMNSQVALLFVWPLSVSPPSPGMFAPGGRDLIYTISVRRAPCAVTKLGRKMVATVIIIIIIIIITTTTTTTTG